MNGCDVAEQAAQTRMLIGALVVLCNTIGVLAVIFTRRNGNG